MRIETLAVHGGDFEDRNAGAMVPPIYMTTTFERDEEGRMPFGYLYSRNGNPTRNLLEECLSKLEAGSACRTFASGMAAAAAVFGVLRSGDHVIAPVDAYYNTGVLLREIFEQRGLEVTFVDLTDIAAVGSAVRSTTRLIWIETPSNPLLKIVDIAAVSAIAHDAGAICVCDNTMATPIAQRPLLLGVDAVVHATTKFLGGHSDVMGGAVIMRQRGEFFERVDRMQTIGGAVPSPFDCWLLLRSINTLALRVRAASATAARIAEFLVSHGNVEHVHYPGLSDHPGHELAARQMDMYGGILSFEVFDGAAGAGRVISAVQLFARATSFGGVHSSIEHRAAVEPPNYGTPEGLLRLSIGAEHVDDLIEDLSHALAR
jgi:cystathionine gamma-synthase